MLPNKFNLSNVPPILAHGGTIWHPKCSPGSVKSMIRLVSVVALVVFSGWSLCQAQSNPWVDRTAQQQPKEGSQGKSDSKGGASLTGCVDEQEGQWVLVNAQTMAVIANLAADGFPTEGFAKHMGHKVTVRGTANSDGTRPTFKVRSIETISETCAAR
jgi:hypothetical protein